MATQFSCKSCVNSCEMEKKAKAILLGRCNDYQPYKKKEKKQETLGPGSD